MSDNKINHDSEDPLQSKIPSNIPESKKTQDELSGEGNDPENQMKPGKPEDENTDIVSSDITAQSSGSDKTATDDAKENKTTNPSLNKDDAEDDLDGKDKNLDSSDKTGDKFPVENNEAADSNTAGIKDAKVPVSEEETIPAIKPPLFQKTRESNDQISLINENLLKVLVTSKKNGVKIDSVVKETAASSVIQANEIYYNPRIDLSLQEVEVLIAIDEHKTEKEPVTEFNAPESEIDSSVQENSETPKSNYLINLINENLLKVKISTGNGVHIDSLARDKKNLFQTQSNKIYLKQKAEKSEQDIEITIAIVTDAAFTGDDLSGMTDEGKIKLIPNPEVMDLIQPPDYSPFITGSDAYTIEDNSYKNPFDALRHLIRKNITIGLIAAVILHLAAAGFAFYKIGKKSKEVAQEEPQRLIVLQDLPDPKIKLEDVEDPNKPKIEPPVITEENEKEMKEPKREIPPRKVVKPPTVTRPKREETKLDSSVEANLNRELDSLRRLREEMLADSNIVSEDSLKSDSVNTAYEIPDSLRSNFNENDIGLAMYFPKNWKLTDQREINKNEKEFKGVVITDTTAEQPGTMTMFIFLDNENKDYNAEDFKTEFSMLDSNLTAFSKEPKTLAGFTEYRFYIFNKLGTEKLSLRASVRKQFFDQYKNEIEAVVRSIRIRKKEDL